MEKQTFEKILPFLDQIEEVTLFGYGESLEHKDFSLFFETISTFQTLRTYLLTNGDLLDNYIDVLVEGGLDFLAISMDGASQETYEFLRPGLSYEKIIRNVQMIQKRKKALGRKRPFLRFSFVGMKRNIHELPELIRMAAGLGVPEVRFCFLVAHDERFFRESLFSYPDLCREILDKARQIAQETRVRLVFPYIEADASGSEPFHRKCSAPWRDFFIGVDGTVRPCMISKQILGDVTKQDIPEIFNGRAFRELRERVNSASPPEDCRTCWHSSCSHVERLPAHYHPGPTLPDSKRA